MKTVGARVFGCVFFAAALIGAPYIGLADANEYSDVHTVAVVSAIGDSLILRTHAIGIFGNGEEMVPITDWGIDSWIADAVTRRISSRFVVKRVSIDKTALESCDGLDRCADAVPKTDAVDAYVLVFKHWCPDPVSGKSDIRGIGVFHHPGLIGSSMNFVHAIYVVAVVDAKNGRIIDNGTGRLTEAGFLGTHADPVRAVPESVWPETGAQMTSSQKEMVRPIVMELLSESLPHALKNANLTAN